MDVLQSDDCWVTWLVSNKQSKELVALKQFAKNDDGQIEKRMLQELWFYKLIFEDTEYDYQNKFVPIKYIKRLKEAAAVSLKEGSQGPQRIEDLQKEKVTNEGIEQILKLYNYFDTDQDTFLCYELGQKTLAKRLCTVKYVRLNNELCYTVKHQYFYKVI
jgi:hypothetical protein